MLTSLTLTGFKNFADATLHLGPFTVLLGANASGKSNLRDAFRFLHGIARGYTIPEIIGEKWGEGGVLQWRGIRGGTRETTYNGTGAMQLRVLFNTPSSLSAKARLLDASYAISIAVDSGTATPVVVSEQLRFGSETVFDSHPKYDPLMPAKDGVHLPVRLMRATSQPGRYGKRLDCLNARPALGQVAESAPTSVASKYASAALEVFASLRFLDLDPDALRRPSLPGQTVLGDRGENLSSVLQAICADPDLKAALTAWIAELTPMDAADFDFPADQQGRILVRLIERNGTAVSAYSASDGTLRFLAILAALLGPTSSRFYFFEELDNGIHPARLHLLLDLIESQARRGKVQMVATTHSPELLTLLSPDSLSDASLVYRLPGSPAGSIRRIDEIPGVAEVLASQDLARLHATGWLEDAVFLSAEEPEATP